MTPISERQSRWRSGALPDAGAPTVNQVNRAQVTQELLFVIETQLRDMKHMKLQSRVADLEALPARTLPP